MKVTKTIYGVSMEIFYIIAVFGWKLCRTNLAAFQGYKSGYTEELIANALKAIDNAKALKTSRQALAARKLARVELLTRSKAVRLSWQLLKGYIDTAFPKNQFDIQLESAGASLYKKGPINWPAVSGLITAANAYINDRLTALKANGNMPHSFPDDFKKAGEFFNEGLSDFHNADIIKRSAVSVKTKANNSIYETLINMIKDGQLVFKADEDDSKREQFTYAFLVSMNKGGTASLRGMARDGNGIAIAGAIIRSGKYAATTDSKGRYTITRMEAGDYTFTITKGEAYAEIIKDVTVKAGQANTLDITLVPALEKTA